MLMNLSEITDKLARAAENLVAPGEARYFAEQYLLSHLKKAPRMTPLQEAIDDLKNWREAEDRRIELILDKPGVRLYDFKGLAPSLKIGELHDSLEEKARANGVAAVGFRNSAGIITLGMWADGLASRGLIGLAMFNGGAGSVIPVGGRKGIFGTNPLAVAIPTAEDPLTLDMATSEIPYFQIKNAREKGGELPPNSAVDQKGRPTRDPVRAMTEDGISNLLPLGGGFKGFGLVLMIEVLTGALIGSLMSHEQQPGWHPTECGCFLLALDPAGFGDRAGFGEQVSTLAGFLRNLDPAEGCPGVVLPGDRGADKIREALRTGAIDLDEKIVSGLAEMEKR